MRILDLGPVQYGEHTLIRKYKAESEHFNRKIIYLDLQGKKKKGTKKPHRPIIEPSVQSKKFISLSTEKSNRPFKLFVRFGVFTRSLTRRQAPIQHARMINPRIRYAQPTPSAGFLFAAVRMKGRINPPKPDPLDAAREESIFC